MVVWYKGGLRGFSRRKRGKIRVWQADADLSTMGKFTGGNTNTAIPHCPGKLSRI